MDPPPQVKALELETSTSANPVVGIIIAATSSAPAEVTLPAAIEALQDTPIYARTNGYVEHWYADIGTHVKQGELLAVISTPEIDQELARMLLARDSRAASGNPMYHGLVVR